MRHCSGAHRALPPRATRGAGVPARGSRRGLGARGNPRAAAAVVQMAARLSPDSWADAAGVATQAEALRERAARLVDDDAEAYRQALEARKSADETARPEQRDWALGRVTSAAAEPPLALARLAADLGVLCAAAGSRVEPRVHADVAAAAAIAAAVARGARELVAVNLTALPATYGSKKPIVSSPPPKRRPGRSRSAGPQEGPARSRALSRDGSGQYYRLLGESIRTFETLARAPRSRRRRCPRPARRLGSPCRVALDLGLLVFPQFVRHRSLLFRPWRPSFGRFTFPDGGLCRDLPSSREKKGPGVAGPFEAGAVRLSSPYGRGPRPRRPGPRGARR